MENCALLLLQRCNHVIMRQHHHPHGHRSGRSGGWQQSQQPDASDAAEWIAGRLPQGWFTGDPTVVIDREEITVIGRLPESDGEESEARASGRAARFREETRPERMRIADEAEDRYGRKVAWGVEVGTAEAPERILFTHIAVPVMTRLRQPERQVLDTLVDAGVARSRSDALAWSVRLVGEHAGVVGQAARTRCQRSMTCAPRAPNSSGDRQLKGIPRFLTTPPLGSFLRVDDYGRDAEGDRATRSRRSAVAWCGSEDTGAPCGRTGGRLRVRRAGPRRRHDHGRGAQTYNRSSPT